MNLYRMFEYAARNKLRFPYKGAISTEDLWDLPVEALDSIYKTLNAKAKQMSEESLLSKPTAKDEELEIQLDIVRHIVQTKQDESMERVAERERAEKKQRLLEILANKEDADLQNKTPEEIRAMIAAMN